MQCQRDLRMQGDHLKVIRASVDKELISGMDADTIMITAAQHAVRWKLDVGSMEVHNALFVRDRNALKPFISLDSQHHCQIIK